MLKIGLIREGKIPPDARVAFTPRQCEWLQENKNVKIVVQTSSNRCFTDEEYRKVGIEVRENLEDCDILMGIKEVPPQMLIEHKTYLFFSHTKKLQPYNQFLFQTILNKKITLIDYECLVHDNGTRVLGFGYFAGVVGAHNGIMAYCNREGLPPLPRVYEARDMNDLVQFYMHWNMPPVKIAVTGSGRVAQGIMEVMNLMGIQKVSPSQFLEQEKFPFPVFVHLYGQELYQNRETGIYSRDEFHTRPSKYKCLFYKYLSHTQVLINGIYWNENIERLFQLEDMRQPSFKITTIADVTDDQFGSVPCNLGDATIENPIYGVDRITGNITKPYLPGSVDVMAVGNLPNELPVESSKYFGEQLIKYVIDDLIANGSSLIEKAVITREGGITKPFEYMAEYGRVLEL